VSRRSAVLTCSGVSVGTESLPIGARRAGFCASMRRVCFSFGGHRHAATRRAFSVEAVCECRGAAFGAHRDAATKGLRRCVPDWVSFGGHRHAATTTKCVQNLVSLI
jgi:hypothetical protein